MSVLPVQIAHRLTLRAPERDWLVEDLWAEEAVGILGGEPKCGKSFLALDIAVAVAAGSPCLRRFPVPRAGRVLLFPAEDALHVVRRRLDGICQVAGLHLSELDIQVITASSLRLDLEQDREALARTVAELRPLLLILDPFVRLHRVDENVSQQVAPLLAFLRQLQREHHLAVLVVHHARKGARHSRAGQALRGSSEFHAWGDSNLYLRRSGDLITLAVEHRAAASIGDVPLHLVTHGGALSLNIDSRSAPPPDTPASPERRIESILGEADRPLSLRRLRAACHMRTSTLCDALATLTSAGRLIKTEHGYELAHQ
jgi:hypothetical protein